MAKMSNCLLCGSEYEVCKMCENVRVYTPWRLQCDTPRHYQIYNTLVADIRKGTLKNTEITDQINQLRLTAEEVKTFVPSVQETLMPFFKTETTKPEKTEAKAKHIAKPAVEK